MSRRFCTSIFFLLLPQQCLLADLLPQNRSFLTVLSGWFQRTEQQRSPAVAEDLIDSGIVTAIPIRSKPSFLLIILYRLRQFSYENTYYTKNIKKYLAGLVK